MAESITQGNITYTGDLLCNCRQSFTAGFQPWCPVHDGSVVLSSPRCWDFVESKPQKCPVCKGDKLMIREEIVDGLPREYPAEECFRCEGKGWVTV